ncbi:MAG: hypothetical protein JNM56_33040 [Planctomycetia bacterium]|nr:hypothetical protein [Planctomycetia bacterium]
MTPCRCGSLLRKVTPQTFANGTRHLREECSACGAFQRYAPQHKAGKPRPAPLVDGAKLLAEFEDSLLARIGGDPAITHDAAGALGDHLLAVADELRRRFGIAEGVA